VSRAVGVRGRTIEAGAAGARVVGRRLGAPGGGSTGWEKRTLRLGCRAGGLGVGGRLDVSEVGGRQGAMCWWSPQRF